MGKFKEINNLYKIKEITNEYVVSQINKKEEKVYIYEITPMLFLDMSSNMQNNIINIYNQLLRLCDFNLQILISNKKLNIDEYIHKYYLDISHVSPNIYNEYIEDMKEKLKQENIYETEIYIIITENFKTESKIIDYQRVIYKLEEIGCKVRKINSLKEYEKILYRTLNKI